MEPDSVQTNLWRNANFLRFWGATVFSALGDAANMILVSWFVIDVTGSEGALGTTLLCLSLPRLIFMLAGGVVADRFNRKRILMFSVLARAVVLSAFSLLLWQGQLAAAKGGVFVMAITFGVVDAFFWPARDSMVPQVIAKEYLATANSLIQTSQQVSMVIGPLLAALLLRLASYQVRFLTMAAFFVISGLFLATLHFSVDRGASGASHKQSVVRDLKTGIAYVWHIRPIAVIMVAVLFLNVLIMGPLNISLPVLIKNLGWSGSSFGYLESAVGIGAIIGGLLAGLAKAFRGHMRILAVFIALIGLGIAAVGFMHNLAFGLTAMLVTGISMSLTNIPVFTYIQTVVDSHMLGRVMALLSLMSMGLAPVSYALTSLILQHGWASPAMTMQIGGVSMAILGLGTLLLKEFRHMEEHPAWRKVGEKSAETSVPVIENA